LPEPRLVENGFSSVGAVTSTVGDGRHGLETLTPVYWLAIAFPFVTSDDAAADRSR